MTVEGAVQRIADEAVKLYRARDRMLNDPHTHTERLLIHGEANGLRKALCVLNGWDVEQESDKEGKADQLVIRRWQETHPEEWNA